MSDFEVCVNSGTTVQHIPGIEQAIEESLITAKTDTLELLGYGNKISNYFVEAFLDKPVIHQVVFYLMLVHAKNKLDVNIQRIIDDQPELQSKDVLKLANSFVLNFDIVSEIIRHKHKAGSLTDGRVKTLAWDLLNNIRNTMLPTASLNEINATIFNEDQNSVNTRLFTDMTYFEQENNSFIFYQLEEKIAECLAALDYTSGKYTALDTLMILGFKERFDLYLYNLMKINEFRREIVLTYGDFKALTELKAEFKYKPSDFYYKKLAKSIERLNNDPRVELYIQASYEPCMKKVPNREDLSAYRFRISLKKNYSTGLKSLKAMCSKISDASDRKLNISDHLFIAALRIKSGDPKEVLEIVKDRIKVCTTKYGPAHQSKNLNLIASYITQSLEDLYKSNHFFERYLKDLKHINGLMYLNARKKKKVVLEDTSVSTFSSDFFNIRDKLDTATSEILTAVEIESKNTDALIIVDYNLIKHSIFETHPHLRHQRKADEQKFLDLVKEAVKLCNIMFGMGNKKKTSNQNYLNELLYDDFIQDNFYLNSEKLKRLLRADPAHWKGDNSKHYFRFWKIVNEFSLKPYQKDGSNHV